MTAAVIIGRNEGERLVRCLNSVVGAVDRTVYVDSGSTDGSVLAARAAGAEVVALDTSQPFTAARGRNAGLERLRATAVRPDYVQFVDGDCELRPDWVKTASAFLDTQPQAAIVCGRRREHFPQASVYNRLCDTEWNTPIGLARSCGGDAMARMIALDEIGGFCPTLIAGEEPEMCVRLRQNGWEIWRLDAEMTLHDAAMTRFSQWWKRMRRGGYAAAQGMAMYGQAPEYHGVKTVLRAVLWGAVLPLLVVALAFAMGPSALLLLFAYPLQVARIAIRKGSSQAAWEGAFFLMLSKFSELGGIFEHFVERWSGRRRGLIEYK